MSDETYWILGGRGTDRAVHTDPNCWKLEEATHRLREAEAWEVEEMDICKECSGESNRGRYGKPDMSQYRAAVNYDPEGNDA